MKIPFSPYSRRRCHGQISTPVTVAIAIGIAGVLALIILFYPKPETEPVPAPSTALETVAPAQSKEERGDNGRDVIAELRNNPNGIDFGAAFDRAQEFHAAGNFADAQLLYFFAARGGNGQAAFELATMYDPNYYLKQASLMERPDAFQAYKWYRDARDAGNEAAIERLDELLAWAEETASANDPEAERLLLQWE